MTFNVLRVLLFIIPFPLLMQLDFSVRSMDSLVISEAARCGMQINEVVGTRSVVGNLEGVIFEVTLKKQHE